MSKQFSNKQILLFLSHCLLVFFLTACQESANPTEETKTLISPTTAETPVTFIETPKPTVESTPVLTQTPATPTPSSLTPSATLTPIPTATRTAFGGWLLFSSRRQDSNGDGVIDEQDGINLYSLNLSTNNLTQLTFGSHRDVNPAWSPDGSQIAFTSNREGNFDLYVMNADGSNLNRLTNSPEWDSKPSWSPDGARIVYVQAKTVEFGLQEKRLYLISPTGTDIQQLTDGPYDDNPDWSVDGRYLAFERQEEFTKADGSTIRETNVYLLNVEEEQTFKLTASDRNPNRGGYVNPQWLPREGYFLSMDQHPGELSSSGLKVFELQWEDSQPALYRVYSIHDTYGRYVWGSNGEWLISIASNNLYYGTVSSDELYDLVRLPVDYSTQQRALSADIYAQTSSSHSLYEAEPITNDTFYDDYPDWTP